MATSAREVLAVRAQRNVARLRLDAQVAKLKADYEDRGIAGRVIDELTEKAGATFDEAAEMAGDSKGLIAGTIGLLAIWFFRHPIISAFEAMLATDPDEEGYDDDDYE